jgi:hypothetical protein
LLVPKRTHGYTYIEKLELDLERDGELLIDETERAFLSMMLSVHPEKFPDKLFVYLSMEGLC